jgi:hypothetical protein
LRQAIFGAGEICPLASRPPSAVRRPRDDVAADRRQ